MAGDQISLRPGARDVPVRGFFQASCLGVWERLAGITDRESFWFAIYAEAGPGKDEEGRWKDIELGLRRLKWRWLRQLLRELNKTAGRRAA